MIPNKFIVTEDFYDNEGDSLLSTKGDVYILVKITESGDSNLIYSLFKREGSNWLMDEEWVTKKIKEGRFIPLNK